MSGFQGLTPEALVQRNDSKNPATTCKGLTSTGRPCRRTLGSTPTSSPAPSPGTSPTKNQDGQGVVAILNKGDAAAYFCWQHKGQAQNLISKVRQERQTTIVPVRKQNSIDSLAEKFGVLDLDADEEQTSHRPRKKRVKKRDTLPTEWQQIQPPLMSIPEDARESLDPTRPRKQSSKPPPRSNVKFSWACCIRGDDDYKDDGPAVRKRTEHRQSHNRPQSMTIQQPQNYASPARSRPSQPVTPSRPPPHPSMGQSPSHSETQNYLSYIPPHLDPTTTSNLLAELSKPFAKDDEPGYIYIFWLTPTSEASVPDDDIASTILDGDLDYQDLSISQSHRQTSNSRAKDRAFALSRYASVKRATAPPKILLKIGRAQNVHRRMTQWTKQCNQNITLVRYYPHYASTAADMSSPGGMKVPHVNRVERLIHVELRGSGMGKDKEKCQDCGREHREWFEVKATRSGLKAVDEIVQRWVRWGEQNA